MGYKETLRERPAISVLKSPKWIWCWVEFETHWLTWTFRSLLTLKLSLFQGHTSSSQVSLSPVYDWTWVWSEKECWSTAIIPRFAMHLWHYVGQWRGTCSSLSLSFLMWKWTRMAMHLNCPSYCTATRVKSNEGLLIALQVSTNGLSVLDLNTDTLREVLKSFPVDLSVRETTEAPHICGGRKIKF